MTAHLARRIAAYLPHRWQQELKRLKFQRQIRKQTFRTLEPEWEIVPSWLEQGDWVVDVGANVGHYTKQFSDAVGAHGRVIAFEPVPATFELLAANVSQFANLNVSLLNLAASDATQELGVSIPDFDTGLKNYYQAMLTSSSAGLQVMTCSLDSLSLPHRIALIKIDAEGHDGIVLDGARDLLIRDRPIVMIESISPSVKELFETLDYTSERLPGSSNAVFRQRIRNAL